MIRDERKDAKYFEAYIAYQTDRIREKIDKLSACGDNAKADRIRLSLLNYQIDMFFAKFSYGADSAELKGVLNGALGTAASMPEVDYESLLNMLSASVLLGKNDKVTALIEGHRNTIHEDKLLNCLASFVENGSVTWDGEFAVKTAFECLKELGTSENKEELLKAYLDTWYETHSDASWYDSHKSDKGTYVGYWSFESAALARIFRVNNEKLKTSRYFPQL